MSLPSLFLLKGMPSPYPFLHLSLLPFTTVPRNGEAPEPFLPTAWGQALPRDRDSEPFPALAPAMLLPLSPSQMTPVPTQPGRSGASSASRVCGGGCEQGVQPALKYGLLLLHLFWENLHPPLVPYRKYFWSYPPQYFEGEVVIEACSCDGLDPSNFQAIFFSIDNLYTFVLLIKLCLPEIAVLPPKRALDIHKRHVFLNISQHSLSLWLLS